MSDLKMGEKIGGEIMPQPPEGGREESGQWNKVVSSMKQMLQELDELVPGTTTAAVNEQNFSPSAIHEEKADFNSNNSKLAEAVEEVISESTNASRTSSLDDIAETTHEPSVFMFKPSPDSPKTTFESQPSPLAGRPHVQTSAKSKSHEVLLRRSTDGITCCPQAAAATKTKKKRSTAFNKWQRLITISSFLATKNKSSKSRGGGGGHENNGHHDNNAATNSTSSSNHNCSKNQATMTKNRQRANTIQSTSNQGEADEMADCCSVADTTDATGGGRNVDRFSFNNFFSRSYSVEETAVRTPPLSIPNHRIHKSTASHHKHQLHHGAHSRSRAELLCSHHHGNQAEQAISAGNIFNQPEFFRTCSCDDKECNSPDGNRQHLWQQQRQSKLSSSSVVWTPNFSSKRMQLRRIVSSDKKMSEHNLFENRQLQSFRDATSGSSVSSHWMDDNDELSKKNKKSRFKKSFKSVSKQLSAPIASTDHFLERKWDTYGECIWCNLSGQQVELESTELSKLSELECEALQKVAVENINELDLPGVPVVIPKDDYSSWKQKHKLKKKYLLLMAKEKQKDKEFDHVFGIPLVQVVENDQLLRLQKSESFAPTMQKLSGSGIDEQFGEFTEGGTSSLSETSTIYSGAENSNAASTASFDKVEEIAGIPLGECDDTDAFPSRSSSVPHTPRVGRLNHTEAFEKSLEVKTPPPLSTPTGTGGSKQNPATPGRPLRRRGAIGADSFHAIDPHQSQLLQALSLSVSNTSESGRQEKKEKASVLPPTMTQVPYIVQKCCDYITKCGLDITGIFRIAGSKKRVKQLREEFDRGVDVTIEESYNPHDVAALLKEFFRDLPEALLTRELYPSFLQSTDLARELRLAFVRYLLWLLPIPNRDSLRTLLRFLYNVAQHCEDSIDDKGQKVTGNLMTVYNLATIFGPNLLHRYKKSTGQSTEGLYQGVERMEDSGGVIKVVEHLINHHIELFEVPKENHDQILRKLKETEPEAVDFILRRKAANYVREKSVQSEQSTSQQENCSSVSRASFPDVFGTVDDEDNSNSYGILRSNLPNSPPISSDVTTNYKQFADNDDDDVHNSPTDKSSPSPPVTSEKQDNHETAATVVELRKQRSISPMATNEQVDNSDHSSSPTTGNHDNSESQPSSPRFIKSHNANNCNNVKMIRKLNRQMRCMGGSVGSNLGQNAVWLQKAKNSPPSPTPVKAAAASSSFKPTPPTTLPLESKLKMDLDLAHYREKLQLSQPKHRFHKQLKSPKVKANTSTSLGGATTPSKKYSKSKTFTSAGGGLVPASSSGGSVVSSSRLPETKV